jgi:hypothetical protein
VVPSVRLPPESFAEIERIAAQPWVPAGALIRGWVLTGLAAEREPRCAARSGPWPRMLSDCSDGRGQRRGLMARGGGAAPGTRGQ